MQRLFYTVLSVLISGSLFGQSVIPLPQSVEHGQGFLTIDRNTALFAEKPFLSEADEFVALFERRAGFAIRASGEPDAPTSIRIIQSASDLPEGGYALDVSPDGVTIQAADAAGALYGTMTLLQLIPFNHSDAVSKAYQLQSVSISDHPRFKWRGLMLDCSRTFVSIPYLKRTIDRLAFYKMNVLHLHFTDDQGWRMDMKSRPLLKEKSTRFAERFHEPEEFQGYYSQEEMADLIAYAEKKHVQLIPEIESPGHSYAALYAYPELSCTQDIKHVFPFWQGERVTKDVFCVGNPGTYAFFKDVIAETASIFPSPYLHLGGDEVHRDRWKECEKCQHLIQSGQVKDTESLQGHFMKTVADYARQSGKRPIAWDEIIRDTTGNISKDWVIMVWRDWSKPNPAIEALQRGHEVVISTTEALYFDYPYRTTSTEKIFDYDPFKTIPDEDHQQRVLGIQANFWSHIDRTPSGMDFQLFPRVLGLAERAWSSASNTDKENFVSRKDDHFSWLEHLQVNYNTLTDHPIAK